MRLALAPLSMWALRIMPSYGLGGGDCEKYEKNLENDHKNEKSS